MANFALWSPHMLETWDFNTPLYRGIGGSETSQVELAERLAKRGHNVVSYAPLGFGGTTHEGVKWLPTEALDTFPENYTWLIYRNPKFFDLPLPEGKYWFVAQDVGYDWTDSQSSRVNKYLALCRAHAAYTEQLWPQFKGRIILTSNGIRRDVIETIEKEGIKRDPLKIIYASSPDRGLLLVLKDWFRVKELCPEAHLHIFYGFQNAEKVMTAGNKALGLQISEIKELLNQKDIHWRGRINQLDLYREWFSAGLWFYPNDFPETSCITCMDAQACGAVPVCNDLWALKQNVFHGRMVPGVPQKDNVCRMSLIWELADLLNNPEKQEATREEMMIDARDTFDWEKFVTQLEELNAKEN